ncbi:hypothetical protein [Mycoplasmopsis agalactiae]|uniref:hypothetical protein n=1 Tax=Mycoplasmopsis agalactiae TaxID=2110 RepID=UPI001455F660|nr:hypothetical protein [Mycoplasmopsis agalactiae]MCE6056948.1 hypothetical protein [Mycoplasmopsis agalactiae]MCE6078734.1 hypothetical protein [Mycoplasmopsis agalactiae]MCE6095121.1 hypothetical protein [Mycoplasmopsis agalactiae]MCE6114371.1 hypothetical protein [Mycoplasmopsis agalactiae]NLS34643.1 hypothetical protein [Mycoplasmopsis agalactiae]
MKKSTRLLFVLTPAAIFATAALAASCDNNEPVKHDEIKEKNELQSQIDKIESELNSNANLSDNVKQKLKKLVEESKDKLKILKTSDEFKQAAEELNKKFEELKKEKKETEPAAPTNPINKNSNDQNGNGDSGKQKDEPQKKPDEDKRESEPNKDKKEKNAPKMPEKNNEEPKTDRDMPENKKEPDKEEPNNNESIPPVVPPADMPSNEPKEEKEDKAEKEPSELDEIVKGLTNILSYVAADEDKEYLIKLKDDSSKYSLWYDKDKRCIWLVEGKESPLDKNNTIEVKFVLFELQNSDKIKGEIQLVNDKMPTIKVKEEDDHEFTNLFNELNFEISKKEKEDKFDITVKYSVGKFFGKGTDPEVSQISGQSTITIDLKK